MGASNSTAGDRLAAQAGRASDFLGRAANAAGQGLQQSQALLAQAQQTADAFQALKGGIVGGDECGASTAYFGGAAAADSDPVQDLKDYRASASAQAKEEVIRRIARALASKGFKVDAEAADLDTIVAQLREVIPSPKKGTNFGTDAAAHKEVCKLVAEALNEQFTPGATASRRLIDTTAGPAAVCRQVSEYVHSLASGLHTEFLQVQVGVKKALQNITALDGVLAGLHDRTVKRLSEGADSEASREAEPYSEAYDRLRAERDQIYKRLENLLHITLAPAEEELAIAMAEEDELYKILKAQKMVPGTGEFGDALAHALTGLGTVAAIASRVQKALKTAGLSTSEYVASGQFADLERALDDRRLRISVDDLGAFERAVEQLKSTFWRHDEIAAALDSKLLRAAAAGPRRDNLEDGEGEGAVGGDEKTTLDRRIETRRVERKLILSQYLKRSSEEYDRLLAAVKKVGPLLGTTIPVTDKLDDLREAFVRLGESADSSSQLNLSLIGFYATATAREKRNGFLTRLRHVHDALHAVASSELYAAHAAPFTAMRDAVDGLVKVIEFYTDVVAKKYGGAGAEEAAGPSGVVGGDDITAEEIGLVDAARSQYDLRSAVNEFIYYFFVAKVGSNLQRTSGELENYGRKYEEILGDAVASRLQALEEERKAVLAAGPATDTCLGDKPPAANAAAPTPAEKAAQDAWTATREAVEEEYKTKKDFYRVVQAVDLYMKAFTMGIAAHPRDVQDIKRQLGEVEVIGRWFTEDSGDALAQLFEMTRRYNGQPGEAGEVSMDGQPHYYEAVGAAVQAGQRLGAGGAQPATEASKMRKQAGRVLENYQALKNLVNAFARLGAKFGGSELRRQVFMSPTEMYKSLMAFLRVSAVSTRLAQSGNNWQATILGQATSQAGSAAEAARSCYLTPAARAGNGAMRNNWAMEMQFFQFVMKSMAAKILVVLGVYDLFERPDPVYTLTPTRIILGGSEAPEVIPAATELYFRMPRLAEFYRKLFAFDEAEEYKISMLPEMDGVFSGLITQIYVRSQAVADTGDYSLEEVASITMECNKIYQHYAREHGEKAVTEALRGFIAEVNRRYAVVKRDEWKKYQSLLRETRNLSENSPMSQTNFAILPGEEDFDLGGRRMAPSDRFLAAGEPGRGPNWQPGLHKLDEDLGAGSMWSRLQAFRKQLSDLLEQGKGRFGKVAYRSLISQARRDIEQAGGPADKLNIVARLVQGSTAVAGSDQNKALMFHETVVLGLNVLTAVYTQLDAFRRHVLAMDLKRFADEAKVWLSEAGVAAGTITPGGLRARLAAKVKGYNAGLSDRYVRGSDATRAGTIWPEPVAQAGDATTMAQAWAAMAAALGAAQPIHDAAGRIMLDQQTIMRDMLVTLFELTGNFDETVTLRYPGTAAAKVHLDFSKLRSTVEGLMSDVRSYLDHFRTSFPAETIKRYEDRSNPGSLYWLEENLVDGMLKGFTDASGSAVGDKVTLEKLSRMVNSTMVELTRQHTGHPTMGAGAVAYAARGAAGFAADGEYEQFGSVLSGLVHWDATRAVAAGTVGLRAGYSLSELITGMRQPGPAGGAPVNAPLMSTGNAPIDQRSEAYNDNSGLGPNRSMLFSFNQLIAMYLSQFYDKPSAKIYQGLIDAFANGAFSQAVMTPGYSQPDLFVGAHDFGARGDPTGRSVLLGSLATIMQRLVKDMNNQGTSMHLVSTLAEIPPYIKENARASLPVFSKMFELLGRQGEMFKQFVQRVQVKCGRVDLQAATGAAADGVAVVTPAGAAAVQVPANGTYAQWTPGFKAGVTLAPLGGVADNRSEAVARRLVDVIDGINSGAYTLSKISQDVLRELADEPLYLQTSEDSIQSYRSRYSKLPLMPLSLALHYLRDVELLGGQGNDTRLTPDHAVGDPEFKMLYGVRGLLSPARKATLAEMPGQKALLESYNAAAAETEKLEAGQYEAFAQRAVGALRYLVDTRSYRATLVASANTYAMQPFVGQGQSITADNAAYSLRDDVTLPRLLEVVDSSFQEEKVAEITRTVGQATAAEAGLGTNRDLERLGNIIDMGEMPVNVHGLQRSMVLAPTYNYSYTLEELICTMYGRTRAAVEALSTNIPRAPAAPNAPQPPKDTTDFFLKLLLDPYAAINEEQFGDDTQARGTAGFVHRICRGDNALGMGRPKYISDQLFSKALFGSIYPSQADFDEAGPGGQVERGRANWGNPGGTDLRGNVRGALTAIANAAGDLDALMTAPPGVAGARAAGAAVEALGALFAALAAGLPRYAAPLGARIGVLTRAARTPEEETELNNLQADTATLATLARLAAAWGAASGTVAVPGTIAATIAGTIRTTPANAPNEVQNVLAAAPFNLAADAVQTIVAEIAAAGGNNAATGAGLLKGFAMVMRPQYQPLKTALTAAQSAATRASGSLNAANVPQAGQTWMGPDTGRLTRAPDFNQAAAPAGRPYGNVLTYLGKADAGGEPHSVIKQVGVGAAKPQLQLLGRERFDSAFVRNLFFITDLSRLMRLKLNTEMAQRRTVLMRGDSLIHPGLTEYGTDPTDGPNEMAGTHEYFSDRSIF